MTKLKWIDGGVGDHAKRILDTIVEVFLKKNLADFALIKEGWIFFNRPQSRYRWAGEAETPSTLK